MFYSPQTLAGSKLKVYVLMKILKLIIQTRTKITSYMIKFAVDQALNNMIPTDDDIADCIEMVLKNHRIRDQFQLNKVVPQLEEIGVESIVIRREGIEFVGRREDYPWNNEFVELYFERKKLVETEWSFP